MEENKPGERDALLADMVKKYESAESSTVDARAGAEKCRDYYDGYQTWTDKEEDTLKKRKQPIIRVNRIASKIDFLKGVEQKNRTDPKSFPRTPKHETDAHAATDALRYVLDSNKFKQIKSDGWENLLIEGECGADIYVKPTGMKDGKVQYEIKVKLVPWDRLFVDPHARNKDRSDASYLGQVVWMDLEVARRRWKDSEAVFDAAVTPEGLNSDTYGDRPQVRWVDENRKRIRLVDMWYLQGGEWWHCIFTKAGFVEEPKKSEYLNELGETEHGLEFQAAYLDRDGNAYGVSRRWLDLQDEINKRRSKAMHLLNVRQSRVTKGAVNDVKKDITEQLAKPDGTVVVNQGYENGFEILPTGDMAMGQFQLLQEAKQELDSVGVNAAMSGQDERSMSGRALLARQESGMAELGPNFDALRDWEHRIYRKVWNRIRQFWTAEKWVRVTDDENNVKFVGLNRTVPKWQVMLEEAQAKGMEVTPEQSQMAQMHPELQEMVTLNNVSSLDVDIVLSEVPDTISLQAEQFDALASLAQGGVPIPPDVLIEASGLRDKQKLIDKLQGKENGIPAQVKMQIQAAQEQLQKAAEELQKREAQVLQGEMKLLQDRAKLVPEELRVREVEARAKIVTANATKEVAVVEAQADVYSAKKKAEADTAKAQAQVIEAQAQSSIGKVAQTLDAIMERLQALERGVPYIPGGSATKTIQITAPSGQTYTGTITQ